MYAKPPVKILLIDDDADEYELFCQALRRYQHSISCEHVTSCLNMPATIYADKPDIILLDFNMPVFNGLDCLKMIKQNDELKNIPVYIFSASDVEEKYAAVCIAAGAVKWIKKPTLFSGYIHVFEELHLV